MSRTSHALELEEQLPELPLTLDGEFVLCVLEELLQLYALATLGVGFTARSNPAIAIATVKIQNKFFIL